MSKEILFKDDVLTEVERLESSFSEIKESLRAVPFGINPEQDSIIADVLIIAAARLVELACNVSQRPNADIIDHIVETKIRWETPEKRYTFNAGPDATPPIADRVERIVPEAN